MGTPEEDGNHFTSNVSHWKTTRVALCNHSWGLEMILAFRNHFGPYLPGNHFPGSSDSSTSCSANIPDTAPPKTHAKTTRHSHTHPEARKTLAQPRKNFSGHVRDGTRQCFVENLPQPAENTRGSEVSGGSQHLPANAPKCSKSTAESLASLIASPSEERLPERYRPAEALKSGNSNWLSS